MHALGVFGLQCFLGAGKVSLVGELDRRPSTPGGVSRPGAQCHDAVTTRPKLLGRRPRIITNPRKLIPQASSTIPATRETPVDADTPPWTPLGCLLISGSGVRNPDGAPHSDNSSAVSRWAGSSAAAEKPHVCRAKPARVRIVALENFLPDFGRVPCSTGVASAALVTSPRRKLCALRVMSVGSGATCSPWRGHRLLHRGGCRACDRGR